MKTFAKLLSLPVKLSQLETHSHENETHSTWERPNEKKFAVAFLGERSCKRPWVEKEETVPDKKPINLY